MLQDAVGDIGDGTFTDIHAIDFLYLVGDIRGSHSAAIHADDYFLELIAHPGAFGYQLRLKLAVAVPGNIEYHIAKRLRLYFLFVGTITAVATVMAFLAVLLIAKMFVQFSLEHLFDALFEHAVEKGVELFLVFELLEKILG
jgi:hypothetical protein